MKLGIILAVFICIVVFLLAACAVALLVKNIENFSDLFNVDIDETDNATKV